MNRISSYKSYIRAILLSLGIFDILRLLQRNRVTILMYHRFSVKQEPFKISIDIFEKQIKYIKSKYNPISLKQYSDSIDSQLSDLPNNPIIITIDDGYHDNYTIAYPILKKYSVPATIFIATDFINDKNWLWFNKLKYLLNQTDMSFFHIELGGITKKYNFDTFNSKRQAKLEIFNYCKKIQPVEINLLLENLSKTLCVNIPDKAPDEFLPLTWDQIIEMKENRIEFGSHTCSHPILTVLKNKEMKNEIVLSKKEIETKLDTEVSSFCYPVGTSNDISDSVIETVKNTGYSCAVTTTFGFNKLQKVNRFLLNRIGLAYGNKAPMARELTRL